MAKAMMLCLLTGVALSGACERTNPMSQAPVPSAVILRAGEASPVTDVRPYLTQAYLDATPQAYCQFIGRPGRMVFARQVSAKLPDGGAFTLDAYYSPDGAKVRAVTLLRAFADGSRVEYNVTPDTTENGLAFVSASGDASPTAGQPMDGESPLRDQLLDAGRVARELTCR